MSFLQSHSDFSVNWCCWHSPGGTSHYAHGTRCDRRRPQLFHSHHSRRLVPVSSIRNCTQRLRALGSNPIDCLGSFLLPCRKCLNVEPTKSIRKGLSLTALFLRSFRNRLRSNLQMFMSKCAACKVLLRDKIV